MKWLKILIWFSLFASCCPKYSAIPQEELVLSEKEVVFLARNCDYVELICSERMINVGNDNEYKYDNIIVNILNKTDCFEGESYSKLISVIGDPSISTDLVVGYKFVKQSESDKFLILNFGLKDGVVHGHALISGHEVKN